MPNLNIEIPQDLYKKFRLAIVERYGGRKGDLTKAVVEAIKQWVEK